jgi:hypothetical protein
VAWCHRQHAKPPAAVRTRRSLADTVAWHEESRKRDRLCRALDERAWRPRGFAETTVLADTLAIQQRRNNLCSCDDNMPSFLCRCHACWAYEIGMCDGVRPDLRRPSRRIECDCMRHAWDADADERWPWHRRQQRRTHVEDALEESVPITLPFIWLTYQFPPGGRYGPDFCPKAAARKLTAADLRVSDADFDKHGFEAYPSYGKV